MATFCDMLLPLSAHVLSKEIGKRFLPTINLQIDYLAASPLGSWVQGEAQLLRATRSLVFMQGLVQADGIAGRARQRHLQDRPAVRRHEAAPSARPDAIAARHREVERASFPLCPLSRAGSASSLAFASSRRRPPCPFAPSPEPTSRTPSSSSTRTATSARARRHAPERDARRNASPIRPGRSPTSSSPATAGRATSRRRSRSTTAGSAAMARTGRSRRGARSARAGSSRSSSGCTGRAFRSATRRFRPTGRRPCSAPATRATLDAQVDAYAATHRRHAARARGDPHDPPRRARGERARRRLPPTCATPTRRCSRSRPRRARRARRPPGADREEFDPDAIIAAEQGGGAAKPSATQLLGVGDKSKGLFLSPLRQLSFWKMKERARAFGESGAHELLARLRIVAPRARFHLMGHSFGCIVVSATVAGPPASRPAAAGRLALPRPGRAVALVVLPATSRMRAGTAGYFHRIVEARARARPDRDDALVARHRRRPLLSARRAAQGPARPRRRAAEVRRHRLVRRPGPRRASQDMRDAARRTSTTGSSRARSTTSRRAA